MRPRPRMMVSPMVVPPMGRVPPRSQGVVELGDLRPPNMGETLSTGLQNIAESLSSGLGHIATVMMRMQQDSKASNRREVLMAFALGQAGRPLPSFDEEEPEEPVHQAEEDPYVPGHEEEPEEPDPPVDQAEEVEPQDPAAEETGTGTERRMRQKTKDPKKKEDKQ